jgi:CubicO group peptidase (beta-lactamase class C family)
MSSKLNSALGCFIAALMASGLSTRASAQTVDFKQLGATVEMVRAKHKLPAMGAAIVTSESLFAIGVAGTRKRGDETPVTQDDLWHIGSDGKAMTATMIARLVERGLMKWDQTLGATFPELAPQMSADMKSVRLHSCCHTTPDSRPTTIGQSTLHERTW